MFGEARLLTPARNYAVVQLPGRRFPGVVFQGDSLHILIGDLEKALSEPDPSERADIFDDVLERLREIRATYETALHEAGIELPY